MKHLPNTPFNKEVDYSLMLLLSALAIQSVAFFIGSRWTTTSQQKILSTISLVVLIASVGISWLQMLRNKKVTFTILGILSAVSFILYILALCHRFIFTLDESIAIFIASFFSARHLMNKWNDEKSPRYFLWGIGGALFASSIAIWISGHFNLITVIVAVIGIGCLTRGPFMGVIVYWFSFAIWVIQLVSVSISGLLTSRSIPGIVGETCMLLLLGVVLSIFLKDEFRWDDLRASWEKMNRPSPSYSSSFSMSKSCGRCGRQVSLSAHSGQRCPHCGAYWSFERDGGFR